MKLNILGKLLGAVVILISLYTLYQFIFNFAINKLAIAAILFCMGTSVVLHASGGDYHKSSGNFLKAGFYISLLLGMKYLIFG